MLVHQKADVLQFLNRLKLRVILTHFLAISFLLIASRQAGTLVMYITLYVQPQPVWLQHIINTVPPTVFVQYAIIVLFYATWVTALTLSIILNVRHSTFWLNSLIAGIGAFISAYIYDIVALRHFFWAFGKLFSRYGDTYYALANIIFYLALGFFIFYSKWTKRWAYGKKPAQINTGGDSPR